MTKCDLLVLGGGPAGLIAAVTAKKSNPQKKVFLVRNQAVGVVPCGIPYVFNRLSAVDKDVLPDKGLVAAGVDIIINQIVKLDLNKKQVQSQDGEIFSFKKIIIALGSEPIKPPIAGLDKSGVFLVEKDMEYLKKMRLAEKRAKHIVVIGGGYIGVELAEELSRQSGKNITIVERLDHCLGSTMDREFSETLEADLVKLGITLRLNTSVESIQGNKKCTEVEVGNNELIPADMVILAAGARPNSHLAQQAGLRITALGSIKVDQYMQAGFPDVYAVGDCASKRCLITKQPLPALLASTACYEARLAGHNVFKPQNLIKNSGTLASFSTFINNTAYAVTGLTEEALAQSKLKNKDYKIENFSVSSGEAETPCHHPGALANTVPIKVKLLFNKANSRLVGAQLKGPAEVGEMINILALAIQKKSTIDDLMMMQVATHPLLTPAPTVYPLIVAAQNALKNKS